jgi:hypothetical protein
MIENAWAASRPDDKCAAAAVNTRACRTHEVHFWIIQNNATKELAISHWAESDTPETASGVREGLPPIIPGFTTVAGFHTHPFTPAQGYNPSKRSAADILNSASEFRNLPSIIKYYDGCFYYGPPLPPDFIKPVPPSEARN